MRTIQLLSREALFFAKYEAASKQQKRAEIDKAWIEAINYAISQTFQYFMQTISYAVGVHLIYIGARPADSVFKYVRILNILLRFRQVCYYIRLITAIYWHHPIHCQKKKAIKL